MFKPNKKYSDVFSSHFLNYFNENKDKIGEIELPADSYKIDLDKIIAGLDLEVEKNFLGLSGEYDSDNRKISVNTFDPIYRQRFTIAHEIGHCVLKHQGLSHRNTNVPSTPKERAANQFAAELLLPPRLIGDAIDQYMKSEGMDEETFKHSSEERLIENLSESMEVSKQAIEYRLCNLGVITR